MLPENASHADTHPGVRIGSVRFEIVGCVYRGGCVVVELFVDALEIEWLGVENGA